MPSPQGKTRREDRWPSLGSLSKPLIVPGPAYHWLSRSWIVCLHLMFSTTSPASPPLLPTCPSIPPAIYSSIPLAFYPFLHLTPAPTLPIPPSLSPPLHSMPPSLLHPTFTSISPASQSFHLPIFILFPCIIVCLPLDLKHCMSVLLFQVGKLERQVWVNGYKSETRLPQ